MNNMMEQFDFADIVEDTNDNVDLGSMMESKRKDDVYQEMSDDPNQFDLEDTDDFSDFEDDEEGEEVVEDDLEDTTSITEALSQLSAVADDFELDFGTQKVSKGELTKLLSDRETITKTRDAIDGLGNRMAGRERDIELFYTVSKTETDKQLEHVYSMLNDPSKWNNSTDVAQLQKARIQLETRKAELDKTREAAMKALNDQKQEMDVVRVQKVVQEMGSPVPVQEAAAYAEAKGISLDALVSGISPALVTALQNAAKYEALTAKNKERLAKAAAEKKPKSKPIGSKVVNRNSPSAKARAYQLYQQGKLSHSDMFNFLED